MVLGRCSVFADGFDLAAATRICADASLDEYAVLDLLDSLVRKSLIIAEYVGGHARYGLLETIRQFAEEKLAASDTIRGVRDRHADHFAEQAASRWEIWDGPRQQEALDWLDNEFANLRVGFRWAVEQHKIATATAIAAHTAMLAWTLQRFEPVGWAEEILPAATAAEVTQLPRLYTAASICVFSGRPEHALEFARTALALEADRRYDPFEPGHSSGWEAAALLFGGRSDRFLELSAALATRPGLSHVVGLCGKLTMLPAFGRTEEAIAIAEETVNAARAHGNPFYIAYALLGYGRSIAQTDPMRALSVLREGLEYVRQHKLVYWEAALGRDIARLEALHGEADEALAMSDTVIDSVLRAGNSVSVVNTLADLMIVFERVGQPGIAATIYGRIAQHTTMAIDLPTVVDRLRSALGDAHFNSCAAAGAAMDAADMVRYARDHIRLARQQLAAGERPASTHELAT